MKNVLMFSDEDVEKMEKQMSGETPPEPTGDENE